MKHSLLPSIHTHTHIHTHIAQTGSTDWPFPPTPTHSSYLQHCLVPGHALPMQVQVVPQLLLTQLVQAAILEQTLNLGGSG